MTLMLAAARASADPQAAASPSGSSLHDGLLLAGAIALGLHGQVDLCAGAMITPRVAVFATELWSSSIADDTDQRLLGAGARVWLTDRAFFDGRIGAGRVRDHEDGAPTMDTTGVGLFAGVGVEILQRRHFSFEFHAEVVHFPGSDALLGGIGIAFH